MIFSYQIKPPTDYSCWVKQLWKEQWLITILWMIKNCPDDGITTASTTPIEENLESLWIFTGVTFIDY